MWEQLETNINNNTSFTGNNNDKKNKKNKKNKNKNKNKNNNSNKNNKNKNNNTNTNNSNSSSSSSSNITSTSNSNSSRKNINRTSLRKPVVETWWKTIWNSILHDYELYIPWILTIHQFLSILIVPPMSSTHTNLTTLTGIWKQPDEPDEYVKHISNIDFAHHHHHAVNALGFNAPYSQYRTMIPLLDPGWIPVETVVSRPSHRSVPSPPRLESSTSTSRSSDWCKPAIRKFACLVNWFCEISRGRGLKGVHLNISWLVEHWLQP